MVNINWQHNLIIKVIGVISVAVFFLGLFCQTFVIVVVPIISQFTTILAVIVFAPLIILQIVLLIFRFRKLDKTDKMFLAVTFLAPVVSVILILLFASLWSTVFHSYNID